MVPFMPLVDPAVEISAMLWRDLKPLFVLFLYCTSRRTDRRLDNQFTLYCPSQSESDRSMPKAAASSRNPVSHASNRVGRGSGRGSSSLPVAQTLAAAPGAFEGTTNVQSRRPPVRERSRPFCYGCVAGIPVLTSDH